MTQKQYDAGTRHYDHCEICSWACSASSCVDLLMLKDFSRLPRWRYMIREALLPVIRLETPPLSQLQRLLRSTFLDSYFAVVANLGTHTFFMIFLPVLFWCEQEKFGRALVNLLAFGVIISGIIKDLLCLPRPVSPPLQRITMSGSVALEYGFPSTHTTNAVSVALYLMRVLSDEAYLGGSWFTSICYVYAFSIAFGRLYCGMHGFLDVIVGSILGALLTVAQLEFGEAINDWLLEGSSVRPLIIALVVLFVVRSHPEPVDDCPCFDDSVAFAGVLIGMNWSYWHVVQPHSALRMLPFVAAERRNISLGVPLICWKTAVRIPIGVAIIVAYRAVTKPLLLRILPPIFRVIEHLDLDSPRRYFLKASQYHRVPNLRRDDNVLPSPSDVGQMIGDVKRQRGRAVSIGPQSVADAYEVLAYREGVKRLRRSSSSASKEEIDADSFGGGPNPFRPTTDAATAAPTATATSAAATSAAATSAAATSAAATSAAAAAFAAAASRDVENGGVADDAEVRERQAIFSALPRTRVRYDVEVVTKLIVYSGIAWWAMEGCPVVFEILNLGP